MVFLPLGQGYNIIFTSLPQIYLTLIISDLYLYGTKMSPQFE